MSETTISGTMKARAFAASKVNRMTEDEFVAEQTGNLHHYNGAKISEADLRAGYRIEKSRHQN